MLLLLLSLSGIPRIAGSAAPDCRDVLIRANQGDIEAQFTIGDMYSKGYCVQKSIPEAIRWWSLAAWNGNVDAQHALGLRYLEGDGVRKDLSKAFLWWKIAAAQGNIRSQIQLEGLKGKMPLSRLREAEKRALNVEEFLRRQGAWNAPGDRK